MTELLHAAVLGTALILLTCGCALLARGLSSAEPPQTFVYQDRLCHWSHGKVSCEQ